MKRLFTRFDLRLGRGLNDREHWRDRYRRVKDEKSITGWMLRITQGVGEAPRLPLIVTMTRCAPSNGLDDDNLTGSLKGVRDAVAEFVGVDDKDERVEWVCQQRRDPVFAVEIEIKEATRAHEE